MAASAVWMQQLNTQESSERIVNAIEGELEMSEQKSVDRKRKRNRVNM